MTFSSVVVDAEWLYTATADKPSSPAERIDVDATFAQDEFDPFEVNSEQFFEAISDDGPVPVDLTLHERRPNVIFPTVRTQNLRSAQALFEDNEWSGGAPRFPASPSVIDSVRARP